MKQPLWAINSSLLFLCILGQVILLFLQTTMPRRTSLEPDSVPMIERQINVTVDIAKIYKENDLFNTYVPAVVSASKISELEIPAIPEAPAIIPLTIPVEAPKVFIAPLPVTLKGVMYVHDRPAQSVAIIQFQNSKEEINYHVGQLINDAQILKIYPNRVIVVRSNGQQETLYLREDDAGRDFAADTAKEISALTIPVKSGIYQIPVEKFVMHVKGLGNFIDLLDLTTVYKQGKSVGCRVGKSDKDSLGSKLGLLYDDVIQQVDGIPVTDIASRILVFDHITQKKIGDNFVVKIERAGKLVQLKYSLVSSPDKKVLQIIPPKAAEAKGQEQALVLGEQAIYDLEQQRKHLLEQKVKLAPTAHQIEFEERKKMMEARRRQMIANRYEQNSLKPMPRFGFVNQQGPQQGLGLPENKIGITT